MSVVRVAVPILQGRRKFHFDKGRPWSVVEHLLLVALARKDATTQELSDQSSLPHRVIIEALIRLMRAGWVEMVQRSGGAPVQFRTTIEGITAARADELPNIARRMTKSMTFVVEQVTGGVFRARELPFLHEWMVRQREEREQIVWIERGQPIVGEVRSLIAALFHDDEKFIAMDSQGAQRHRDVDEELQAGRVALKLWCGE